jgi:hypothetical protein
MFLDASLILTEAMLESNEITSTVSSSVAFIPDIWPRTLSFSNSTVEFEISSTVSSPIDMIELTETEDGFISETDSVVATDS